MKLKQVVQDCVLRFNLLHRDEKNMNQTYEYNILSMDLIKMINVDKKKYKYIRSII